MSNLFLLFILGLSFNALTQSIDLNWVRSAGGTADDSGHAITVDPDGNVITVGYFENTVDFDPGPGIYNLTYQGSTDNFVLKLDPAGNFVWAYRIGDLSPFQFSSVKTDSQGNIIIVGSFMGTNDFNMGAGTLNYSSSGLEDIFILKLDPSGNTLWIKKMGSTASDGAKSATINEQDDILITGYFSNTVDFDPNAGTSNLTSAGNTDVFILKMSSSGNFMWVKQFQGTQEGIGSSIECIMTGSKEIICSGVFKGSFDFDPGPATNLQTATSTVEQYLVKLDSIGNLLWVNHMGGSIYYDLPASIIDPSGNIYTTGEFDGNVDFDPGVGNVTLSSAGYDDAYIQKVDLNGNFLWVKQIKGTYFQFGSDIVLDLDNNVYATGSYSNQTTFEPGGISFDLNGMWTNEAYIVVLDSLGEFKNVQSLSSPQSEVAFGICADDQGNIFVTGEYGSSIDFDPGLGVNTQTSVGQRDIFIEKISLCFVDSTLQTISSCEPYTWLDGNTYSTSTNTPYYILNNQSGCDSIIYLNLTINQPVITVSYLDEISLQVDNSNGVYQWLDCDNTMQIINNETNQSFTATLNGNYAVEVTQNSCTDTSSCYSITSVGIDEFMKHHQIDIFPNPTQGELNIHSKSILNVINLKIVNLQGKVVFSSSYQNTSEIQENMFFEPGFYIVELLSSSGAILTKEMIVLTVEGN